MTTLIADPAVTAIAVRECGEPLADLAEYGLALSPAAAAGAGRFARVGLARRLAVADAALPPGVRLLIVEGLRSAADQVAVAAGYAGQLRAANPGLSTTELRRLASRYVAPLEVAPHVAGAAVDVTLVDAAGRELWMGTPVDATPEDSDGACAFDAPGIGAVARSHRVLLAAVLGPHLVNYPTEWWHWSYGDRYWALRTGAGRAHYGPVDAPQRLAVGP